LEKPKYDVFLSHATPDKPVVEELAKLLKKRGFEPWLDKWNLIPGDPWQEAIEKALEECTACAVFLGPSGTGPWQNEEMRAAIDRRVSDRSRQFRVIPVLLPRAERGEPSRLPAFLRATTWVEFRSTLDDEKALHRLIAGIRGLPPGSDPGEAVAEGACPYRGLQVFDVGDSLFFFGREALTEWLLDKLRADRSGSRFLAIVGPSGSGKSSLARAGLLAALKRGEIPGSDAWLMAVCKPGSEPLPSLSLAFAKAFRLSDASTVLGLNRDLLADPRALHVATQLQLSLGDTPADRRLVVLVDQFEEVFTLCPDEPQRQAIIANLLHAATTADGQTVVVLTLRADFYGRCAAYPDLAAAVSDRQSLVGPMTRDELRNAIERPAYLAGCELEGGLADLLLNEVESQPGSLPLLEHALLQVWQRREGGRRLTIDAYREIGGVAGALEKHAEEIYGSFSEEEKETCRSVFLRLVQVDEQGRATKRRLGLDELVPAGTVISRLTNARLLTTDQEKVEVAHEALLTNWARLKQWIEQDREALRTRRRLDEAVAEWLGMKRDPSFLLEGGRLAQIEDWAERHPGEMGAEARELLAASVAERDRDRQRELAQAKALEEEQRRRADAEHQRAEEQVRARRRQRKWLIVAGLIAAVAIGAAVTALYQRRIAERRRRIARAEELSEHSRTVTASNPQLGLLLATEALKMARGAGEPYLPSVNSALRWALDRSSGTPLSGGPIAAMAVDRDRHAFATVGRDRHIHLWNMGAYKPAPARDLGEIPENENTPAAALAGGWLLIAGGKGSWLLDLRNPDTKLETAVFLKAEDWPFANTPISADGRWLVTRKDGDLYLRDLGTKGSPVVFVSQNEVVNSFAFSPDGLRLATVSRGGLIKIRVLRSPYNAVVESKIDNDLIFRLAFSKEGQALFAVYPEGVNSIIVAVLRDGSTAERADLQDCNLVLSLKACKDKTCFACLSGKGQGSIWSYGLGVGPKKEASWSFGLDAVDFSPDGSRFAAGDSEGNIYLQSIDELKSPLEKILNQTTPVQYISLSESARWLLSQGGSEAPRFWDLSKLPDISGSESRIFRFSDKEFPALSEKGEILRRDLASGQLLLWKLTGEPASQNFSGSEKIFPRYTVSADGQWFAAVSRGGTLLLWKIKPDGEVGQPEALASEFSPATLRFSPGGRWLAAVEFTGKCRLWDLRNLKSPPHFLTNMRFGSTALAFAPGDDKVATGGPYGEIHLRILDAAGPKIADSRNSPNASVSPRALAFSPDGEWIAIGGGGNRFQVWKTSGRNIFLESRSASIAAISFSADGQWLVAGGSDGLIQLWRWAGEKTNPAPILLAGHTGYVGSVVFTPQGLLSASRDHTVRLWELRPEKLIKLACQSAGRTLSKSEWATYLLSEPYEPDEPCPGLPKAPD
jgi:WD40 repeat protein